MNNGTKRFNPGAAKAMALKKTGERPLEPTEPIGPTTEEQNPSPELSNLVQSVKALQETALEELEQTMEDLAADFTARAVAIVQRGTQQCFLQASQQISQIQIGWTSNTGGLLDGNTIEAIALPGSTTDGDTE